MIGMVNAFIVNRHRRLRIPLVVEPVSGGEIGPEGFCQCVERIFIQDRCVRQRHLVNIIDVQRTEAQIGRLIQVFLVRLKIN